MQDAIAAALKQKDFQSAAALIKQWQQADAKNPHLWLMIGHYQEATQRWESAERAYLKLLRQTPSQKLIGQARQGLQRVQLQIAQAQQEALEAARSQPHSQEPSLLCLVPVTGEQRQQAAQGLARVLEIDAYSASLKIPSQELRLFRVGPAGELQHTCQRLADANMPSFWRMQKDIAALAVFRVQYFKQVQSMVEVVCLNSTGQLGAIAFRWSEVSQVISGQLPLFESVVDRDVQNKIHRKEATQDHAEVMDLHLHNRKCILRLCDRTYDFRQESPLPQADAIPDTAISTRPQWNGLTSYIRQQIQVPTHHRFTQFGESALEYLELLPSMPTYIHLNRKEPSYWDTAFQVYSGLHFWKHSEASPPQ